MGRLRPEVEVTGRRVLVFGVQGLCLRSDNYPVANRQSKARDEILVFGPA